MGALSKRCRQVATRRGWRRQSIEDRFTRIDNDRKMTKKERRRGESWPTCDTKLSMAMLLWTSSRLGELSAAVSFELRSQQGKGRERGCRRKRGKENDETAVD